VWSVGDYLAARSVHRVLSANTSDAAVAASIQSPHGLLNAGTRIASPPKADPATTVLVDNTAPYADPAFKVQRRPQHAVTHPSLRETLVQRSEARARADLLRQTQEYVHRSQYDCEAAERAVKYLNAGLDVWGFATWQVKYFPREGYKGATLPQCKDIGNVGDAPGLDSQSPVANGNHTGKHVYNGIPFTESFESSRRLMQAWSGSGLGGASMLSPNGSPLTVCFASWSTMDFSADPSPVT
jgi:hypothetical protein